MTAGCAADLVWGALRFAGFVFLLHGIVMEGWCRRAGMMPFVGAALALMTAIAAFTLGLDSNCAQFKGTTAAGLGIFLPPFIGAFVLSFMLESRGFPRSHKSYKALFFSCLLATPFLGAVVAVTWRLLSLGLPHLLFMPPQADPEKRSVRESVIGGFFGLVLVLAVIFVALIVIVAVLA